jgi:hypothetical protein
MDDRDGQRKCEMGDPSPPPANHPRKGYFTLGIELGTEWVSKEQVVCYKGHEIIIRPETEDAAPSLVLPLVDEKTARWAYQILLEFLSSMAWIKGRGSVVRMGVATTAPNPMRIGKQQFREINDVAIEYVPDPTDPKARLVLALYREALSVNLVPYKFLGFFKIINAIHKKGPKQVEWIDGHLDKITARQAVDRLHAIQKACESVGEYLYVQGRCAVAHAFGDPIVNPDDPEHLQRLWLDLPVVQALAEYAIEHEFGVPSLASIEREHQYELEGFRDLFGPDVVARLKRGELVEPEVVHVPAHLSIRLRGHAPFEAFEGMNATATPQADGVVTIVLHSPQFQLEIGVHLCFMQKRLVLATEQGLKWSDDGTIDAARGLRDARAFSWHWLCNGVLEVWDASTRLGRSQPNMPLNIRPDYDGAMADIEEAEQLIAMRNGDALASNEDADGHTTSERT